MKHETIDQFRCYLKGQGYSTVTIRDYVRTVNDLKEPPPDTGDPIALLVYIERSLESLRQSLSRTSFLSAQAALHSYFFMRTDIRFKDFRKTCANKDQYDPLMIQYTSYCRDFLHLTEQVTLASVRETKRFLRATVPNINIIDWKVITAFDIIKYLSNERNDLCTASVGVTVSEIRRFFRFLQHQDIEINSSILNLPLSIPKWSKGSTLPVTLTEKELFYAKDFFIRRKRAGCLKQGALLVLCSDNKFLVQSEEVFHLIFFTKPTFLTGILDRNLPF